MSRCGVIYSKDKQSIETYNSKYIIRKRHEDKRNKKSDEHDDVKCLKYFESFGLQCILFPISSDPKLIFYCIYYELSTT